jgi:diguanylate cyclase (GGDEF)-like protein
VVIGLFYVAWDTVGIAAGVAVGAALVAIGIVLLVLRRFRRGRSPDERVSALVRELDERMRQLGDNLSEELERTKEESRRSRYLGELAWTIEMEEVMRRTLDAAAQLEGVDAALITALDPQGQPITRGAGLSDEEMAQLALDQRTGSGRVQSLTISYAPTPPPITNEPAPVAISLQVPIEARARRIGVISVFSRDELRPFPEDTQRSLEDLASRAGPALDNARRYLEARRLADLDARTGLHNARYFEETLEREVARAGRYDRKLALVVFDLDDFKQINERFLHVGGNAALAGVADRMREVLRSADVAARYGGDEFAVILPESGVEEARRFYERLRAHIEATPIPPAGNISLSCGIGELEKQQGGRREDWDAFFKRVDKALYRAKRAGKGQVMEAYSGLRLITDEDDDDENGGSAISDIDEPNNGNGAAL